MEAPQEPRWLDAEERQAWLALASALNRLPAALDAQLRRDAGISHFEYQVMALLSDAPGFTLRMSELAMMAEGSLPRLSQVVARLEQHGWVRRTPDPADGRYTLATLTEQGRAKVTEAAPGHVQEVRRLVFDPAAARDQPTHHARRRPRQPPPLRLGAARRHARTGFHPGQRPGRWRWFPRTGSRPFGRPRSLPLPRLDNVHRALGRCNADQL
jgi:DNA-binding MarR family transcriptional regulator